MKERVISGVIMAAIVVAVLILGSFVPLVFTIFIALLSALCVYELMWNTGGAKDIYALVWGILYAVAIKFAYSGYFAFFGPAYVVHSVSSYYNTLSSVTVTLITVIYMLGIIILSLFRHNTFGLKEIAVSFTVPVALGFAFNSIEYLLLNFGHLFGFFLIFNFACMCDMGGYFVGRKLGKHKLAPIISPKKTVEGSIGGVIFSLAATALIVVLYNKIGGYEYNLVKWLLFTPLFCVIGMIGDLFASAIKRSAGIKDYSNLFPGHGGIMDRLDSVLLIAPCLQLFSQFGILS